VLATLATGTPKEVLRAALAASPLDRRTLGERVVLPTESFTTALANLLADGRAVLLSSDATAPRPANVIASAPVWEGLLARLCDLLAVYHQSFPLRGGMSKEEVKSRLGLPPRLADAVTGAALRAGAIAEDGPVFRLPDHRIAFTPAQQAIVDRYLAALAAQPYAPPAPAELGVPPDLLAALVETGQVRRLDDTVVFSPAAYAEIVAETLRLLDTDGTITVARFRDRFGSSRRYALAVLEHFDRLHLTRRVGDERVRGHAALK
jgi:selenocysteine-specific elongation factor